ncbi:MAG TPA: GNAT family N-acetyltransferase [Phycisphaerae bacterium]|nr:GNAT family N-acetyltransferase [Phycisphaerae bacterium]
MIRYIESLEGVSAEMLQGFFDGWTEPRTPEQHMKILEGSDHIVLGVDGDSGRVVGFVTAMTDGIQAAFIPLLEVLPAYRHRGIGAALVTRMLEKLKGIPAIDLTCDPEVQRFYTRFGMTPSVGMVIRDY